MNFFTKSGILCSLIAGSIMVYQSSCKNDSSEPESCPCLERAIFGDPSESLYLLPFPVGKNYVLSQSYCNPNGGHANQLAYDFAFPIGDTVTAARAGEVLEIREDLADIGNSSDPGAHNHIFIRHHDGSVSFYAHLQENGVLVEKGDQVQAGQQIASSGNSGNTGNFPHLHFGVYESWPAKEGFDLAINFRNAVGPLDELGGLVVDKFYKAGGY